MFVCLCHGVSDKQVCEAIHRGATDLEAVQRKCLAGSSCGTCVPAIEELIEKHGQQSAQCCRMPRPRAGE